VSDMQTTRALLGATVVVGGFIVTLITRCVLLISLQAAVGSWLSGCTGTSILISAMVACEDYYEFSYGELVCLRIIQRGI